MVGIAAASHVTHGKVRTLDVTTRDAYINLDYQEQDVRIQRRGLEQTTTLREHSGYRTETISETPFVTTREPLKIELEHFLECVRERQRPRVDGRDGVRAVRIATEIVEQISETRGENKKVRRE
jgi:predicted dehydrogenase